MLLKFQDQQGRKMATKSEIKDVRNDLRAWLADQPVQVRKAGGLVLGGLDALLIFPSRTDVVFKYLSADVAELDRLARGLWGPER